MDEKSENGATLHPRARQILTLISPDAGADAALSAADLKRLKQELVFEVQDRVLFEHLCVLWWWLNPRGLHKAAAQLLDLAGIGLSREAIERTLAEPELGRAAAKLLAGAPAAGPLGVDKPSPLRGGVGLRGARAGQKPPSKKM